MSVLAAEHVELSRLDAHAQADLVRRGEVSPEAPVEAAIRQIEALDPALNAVSYRAFSFARERARSLDRTAPMAGVPCLLKASMEYPGLPFVSGSRAKEGAIGAQAWPLAQRMDEAGLIPCGLATMPEFGLIGTGEALLYGPTRNPWNPDYASGGSSSGSAVAVAVGMVPFATGSDGGGSIRIPASHCGIVGFKPSRDWNLRARAPGLMDDLLASDGLMARTMRDTAWAAHYLRRQAPAEFRAGRSLRIAFSLKGLDGLDPEPEITEMLGKAAQVCEELGHDVVAQELPLDMAAYRKAFDVLWSYGAGEVVDITQARLGARAESLLEPWTLGLAERRGLFGPDELARALGLIGLLHRDMQDFWERFDVVLSPVASSTAPKLGVLAPDREFDALWRDHFRHVNYTQLQNMAGYPGLSLPLFQAANGMPAGAMFWTRQGGDDLLLALGAALEEACPWADRTPPGFAGNMAE